MDRRTALTGSLAGLLALTAAACGSASSAGSSAGTGGSDAGGAGGTGPTGYPLEIANCEATLTFEQAPERVMLLESSPVTILDGIGVLDRVIARAGAFPLGYYDADLSARITSIPALSEDVDASGHLLISQEMVLAQSPDLVCGLPDGVTREGLRAAGCEALVQEVFCAAPGERASFSDLAATIDLYGRIFDRADAAAELAGSLETRIEAARTAAETLTTASAAVLYPSIGGGPLYTYGAGSMATAQLDVLGIENPFATTPERIVEISAEPLLAADPDALIVLYQGEGDGAAVTAEMVSADQLSGLRAVQEGRVLPLLFNFAEPASPLVVDGLERILAWLQEAEG